LGFFCAPRYQQPGHEIDEKGIHSELKNIYTLTAKQTWETAVKLYIFFYAV
jgi:hypothetical protein